MEVRELTGENIEQYLPACSALQKQLVRDTQTIDQDHFVATAQDTHSYFLGVFEAQSLIGMGVLSKVVHPVAVTGYINNVVVSAEHRGQGYFSAIMDELEQKARQWNCTRIDLTCSRETVQPLYEKRGYIRKETNFYILKI